MGSYEVITGYICIDRSGMILDSDKGAYESASAHRHSQDSALLARQNMKGKSTNPLATHPVNPPPHPLLHPSPRIRPNRLKQGGGGGAVSKVRGAP